MQALVLAPDHKTAHVKTVPTPTPGPKEIQVKVHTIALNPVDALYTAHPLGSPGRTVGSDFAGIVTAVGETVDRALLGKRVAGFLQGACSMNERPGAFAEFLCVDWDLVWVIRDEQLGLREAATVSLCALTAAQALYLRLGLPAPWAATETGEKEGEDVDGKVVNILIYGASTSVALYAAQLIHRSARTSGQKIQLYGVASATHHSF